MKSSLVAARLQSVGLLKTRPFLEAMERQFAAIVKEQDGQHGHHNG
jgi:hypothetical protein